MNTIIVRAPETDRRAIDIPTDPFDLTGIAVDYQDSSGLSFASGVSTRMQWDTSIIGSNFVTPGAAWQWAAPSTALYQFIAQATFVMKSTVEYHISMVLYKNGVAYKGIASTVTPLTNFLQTVALTTIIPCAAGDILYVQYIVVASDASATPLTATGIVNFVNILRLWKTYQQALGIASNVAPPPDGGGSHVRG